MMEQQRAALEEQQRKAKGRNMRNITPKSRNPCSAFRLRKCVRPRGRTFSWKGAGKIFCRRKPQKGKELPYRISSKTGPLHLERAGFPRHIFIA